MYTAVDDPEIIAKVQGKLSSAKPDLKKATEVTDPELFLKIQEQLKKDLETQEEIDIANQEVTESSAIGQFLEGLGGRLGGRFETIQQISEKAGGFSMDAEGKPVYNPPEQLGFITDIQTAGQFAGGVFDVLGETLTLGAKGISFVTPDFIKDPIKEGWAAGVEFITSNPKSIEALKAVEGGVESYGEWKKENPESALTLESVVNLGLLFAPVPKGGKVKGNPDFVGASKPNVT